MGSVDVYVPCYRYGHFLRECVNSVLHQSIEILRVLIIDDASPDDTAAVAGELAAADARVEFVRHRENKGHIRTYNEGIEWLSAEYSLLLSADDYLLPEALRRAVELMDAHPDVGLVFGKVVELRADGRRLTDTPANTAIMRAARGRKWNILSGAEFFQLVEESNAINIVPTPTAIVRTSLQKRVGGYRSELPHTGDLEMWLRLAAHAKVAVIADYQAVSRMHGGNMQYSYYAENHWPHMQQKIAAFDHAFENFGHLLPGREQLQQKIRSRLAHEALGYASGAFNAGRVDIYTKLCRTASTLSPGITRSPQWFVVRLKRILGMRICRVLVPAGKRLKQLLRKMRPVPS